MKNRNLILFTAILAILTCAARPAEKPVKLQWMSIDEVPASLQKEKRPLLIDLYTDWCGWCKVMDQKTYSDKRVADYISRKFYAVKVNAETRNVIRWDTKSYSFNPQYRSNDFAIYLTGGRLQFPTTVFIPGDGSQPQAIPGYLQPKDFELLLKYFGEGAYGKIPFEDYQKKFKPEWQP